MTPPQVQLSLQLLSSAGMFPINTVGAPGTQGAGVTGTHGMGVSTPSAAEVAAATVGLARLLQTPNGAMLATGALSMMVAAGTPPAIVRFAGRTISELGAAPKLHWSIAPMTT